MFTMSMLMSMFSFRYVLCFVFININKNKEDARARQFRISVTQAALCMVVAGVWMFQFHWGSYSRWQDGEGESGGRMINCRTAVGRMPARRPNHTARCKRQRQLPLESANGCHLASFLVVVVIAMVVATSRRSNSKSGSATSVHMK